jgi:hypothetical protein
MALSEDEEFELLAMERERAGQAPQAPNPPPLRAPAGARPSQADVRAAEPTLEPKEAQRVEEARFEAARKGWRAATKGVLKPGETENQAVAAWAKIRDPRETREQAETAQLVQTGELPQDESVAYAASKGLAAAGGFALAGPGGATGAEAVVRATSLLYNLKKAVDAGMDEDRAVEIFTTEFAKGMGTDAAFNFGIPLLGQILGKVPGLGTLGTKIKAAIEKRAGSISGTKPPLKDAKVASREALTTDPARKEAVRELSKRAGDGSYVPTPGQVEGRLGVTEATVQRAFPGTFDAQEKAMLGAADDMLRETTTPAAQMGAKDLGQTITTIADETQRAVKKRLRPAFQAADDLGVAVDMRNARIEASRALLEDSKVAGGRLKPAERADLEKIFEDLRTNPNMTPEAVLDFISRRKEIARSHTADGKPSEYFTGIMTKLATAADDAFTQSARAVGQPEVAANLLRARKQYGGMMETIYEDAVKQALKKNPEDIGRLFWQGGNVSEIEQLHRMLRMAEKEGVVGGAGAQKVKQDMARGFLQEGVRDVESAAKWLDTLKQDPLKRRTWDALTTGSDGQALRQAMDVVSHAAQIAGGSQMAGKVLIPFGRAAAGGLGVSYVTGVINPGMAAVGLSVAALMKAMATAYTRGDKGAINFITKVMRTNSVGTAAAAKATQALLPELERLAQKYDAADVFVSAEEAQ